jgi:predicted  nucleic acid-binding Zn-ribbon protein
MSDNTDPESIDREALRDHAIDEAKRVRDDIPGNDERFRTQRAILDRERELTGFSVERQHTEQAIDEAESTIEDHRETLSRLRDLDDSQTLFERLPNGTLVAVPSEDREEFEFRLETQLGKAQSTVDAQQDRLEAIKRGVAINEMAIEWLEDELGQLTSADDPHESAGGEE